MKLSPLISKLVDKIRCFNWYSQVKNVYWEKYLAKPNFIRNQPKMYLTLEGYLINNSKSIHHNFKLPHLILSLVISDHVLST